jgi:hypothetical protein
MAPDAVAPTRQLEALQALMEAAFSVADRESAGTER